jgi:hypothetical protein
LHRGVCTGLRNKSDVSSAVEPQCLTLFVPVGSVREVGVVLQDSLRRQRSRTRMPGRGDLGRQRMVAMVFFFLATGISGATRTTPGFRTCLNCLARAAYQRDSDSSNPGICQRQPDRAYRFKVLTSSWLQRGQLLRNNLQAGWPGNRRSSLARANRLPVEWGDTMGQCGRKGDPEVQTCRGGERTDSSGGIEEQHGMGWVGVVGHGGVTGLRDGPLHWL